MSTATSFGIMTIIRNIVYKYYIKKCHAFNLERVFVREFSKKNKSRRVLATAKALNHFDDFYGGIFKYKWHSIRLALLSYPKHVALLNNFGEIEKTKELLKNNGALDLRVLLSPKESDLGDLGNLTAKDKAESDGAEEATDNGIEEEEVLRALYPEGDYRKFDSYFKDYKVKDDEEDNTCDEPASLHEALGHSQIDTSRLIDPSQGLDSSSLHEYIPVTELKGLEGYIPERDYYRFYQVKSEIDIHIEPQNELPIPEKLNVYSYPRGDVTKFPRPVICVNRVFNYYLLDGGSILPVLALGLEPGDRVLDMCAAPGGKSLTILQTMLPQLMVCNDRSISRSNRLLNVLNQYLDNYPDDWRDSIILKRVRGELYCNDKSFNKILVDVPCTSDRISVKEENNNIFKSSRTKERLTLPELQTNLLKNALAIVEPGGTVVYSTCTLSPIQNDGVVNLALREVWKDHGIEFTVVDLRPALAKMDDFYRFATRIGLKYGSLIVPFMPVNFGPMYFCKLVKNK